MSEPLKSLLSAADSALGGDAQADSLQAWGAIGRELMTLLMRRNGFYAFESALLVRPVQNGQVPLGIQEWNNPALWKRSYAERLDDVLFFAEDVFGGQFCVRGNRIGTFEPETGLISELAGSIDEWAEQILARPNYLTGYPLSHTWQMTNGPLPHGTRLVPKTPFVLGGKYELANLHAMRDAESMSFRASIANHIRDVPDGGKVILRIKT
ncbi:MAG TPA: hypothetical protein VN541_23535 [Tepidisphaeraceae bacterium]|nr:hypothetical protein [Tepidisphaeraceae bacterium]